MRLEGSRTISEEKFGQLVDAAYSTQPYNDLLCNDTSRPLSREEMVIVVAAVLRGLGYEIGENHGKCNSDCG